MRYAFVSDIHANRQAWEATWADISSRSIDRVVCLGDIVGYGPCPATTFVDVHARAHSFVIGNHDAAAAGLFDAELFTEEAQSVIAWTSKRLGPELLAAVKTMPYVVRIDCGAFNALCTHGSLPEPEGFDYIFGEEEASETWKACEEKLVFVGHTHVPKVDVLDSHDQYTSSPAVDFPVTDGKRYIVNVGSVGMPRTADVRACYCIFDTDTRAVVWRRVPYRLDSLQADVHRNLGNVPGRELILTAFNMDHTVSLRERLDFTPRKKTITLRRRSRMQPRPYVQAGTADAARRQYVADTLSASAPLTAAEKEDRAARRVAMLVGGIVAGVLALAMVIGVVWQAMREPPPPPPTRGAAKTPPAALTLADVKKALAPKPRQLTDAQKARVAVALQLLQFADLAAAGQVDAIGVYGKLERLRNEAKGTGYGRIVAGLRSTYERDGAAGLATAMHVGETLVPRGAVWRYLDGRTNAPPEWSAPAFDDSAWSEGPSQLGYGDGDEATQLSFGPDARKKPLACYFRHRFDVPNARRFADLYLRLLRDDGAVVYLNGREIARSNMPDGEIGPATVAKTAVAGAGPENRYHGAALGTNVLAEGRNVIAVEVHQHEQKSSDISFDFELIGITPDPPGP